MTDQGAHRLGDVLREAREEKGVDLLRVERDTKIRERYLSALERGEYRELPGSVYTKGFLRNYGAYLGLDPEYLIDLYRIETTAVPERPRMPSPPRPIAARRSRAFVITPGAIYGAVLTIAVGAFIAYLAFEIINFARTPELRITQPPGNVSDYTGDEITIRGATAPNAQVVVDNLRENPQVTADEDGTFEVTVGLVPGSNVVSLVATDPQTGRASEAEQRTIVVVTDVAASPTPDADELAIDEPADDATFTGPVPVTGTAAAGSEIVVAVQLVDFAAPTFTVTDRSGAVVDIEAQPPETPGPTTIAADTSGAFTTDLQLPPGRWELAIRAGSLDPVVRIVTVQPADGIAGTLAVEGGESYLQIDEDGTPMEGVWGGIAVDGDRIDLEAAEELRVLAGNAAAVQLTINGINLGVMGGEGAVVEWRITPTGD